MRRQFKIHSVRRLLAASLAFSVVGAVNGVSYAFPSLGTDCASCHVDTGFGTVTTDPNALSLLPGQTGTVTFDVANIPADAEGAALSLTGFDAAGLEATPDAAWRDRGAGQFTLGVDADGPQTFDVMIGSGAVPGDYPIGVFLAGDGSSPDGKWSAMSEFTISVGQIPEPATVTLVSILLAVGAINITRRPRRK